MERRLYRSRSERVIWGVCGGLAKYFDIDPTLVRIIFVLLALANGIGILGYIILAIVVPLEGSKTSEPRETIKENVDEIKETAGELGSEIRSIFTDGDTSEETHKIHQRRNMLGIILVVLGILFLMGTLNLFWWFWWGYLWPIIPIAAGLIIIFGNRRKK